MINAGLEAPTLQFLAERDIVALCAELLKVAKPEGDQLIVVSRVANILGKVVKLPNGVAAVVQNKDLLFKVLVYFCNDEPEL